MAVAYIVKRYPRYSETFIVNEILAHEKAGLAVEIYALLPPQDTHFQDIISRVKAPVIYLSAKASRTKKFWHLMKCVSVYFPFMWQQINRFPEADVREIQQALELALHIKKKNIDHLHAHFATTSTTVAQLASAITETPFTFTAHAKDIFHQDNDFDVLKTKFNQATRAITVSDFNIRYLTKELCISSSQLVRVYNGLDLEHFPCSLPDNRQPIICAIGRLVEKKGFSVLINACRLLRNKGVDFHCQIIGSGELETVLKQQITKLNLDEDIDMLGSLPQKTVKQIINEAAVFAAPCVVGVDGNRDGLPTVLLESMALGTPCVSTAVTGIPEVIVDNETGLMAEQNDPHSLAVALEKLLTDKKQRLYLASNARKLIEEKFDIDVNAAQIRGCFTSRAQ